MENIVQFIETEYTNGNRQIMYVPTSRTYQALRDELNSVGNNNIQYIVLENIDPEPGLKRAIYEFYNFDNKNWDFLFENSTNLKLYALKRVNNG